MRLAITVHRLRGRLVGPLVVAAAMTLPAAVLAGHQFWDVANNHPFHDDISAIAGAGITAGFPDGGYHPTDAVTRQAMAAFMERGFGHVSFAAGTAPMTASVDVDSVSYVSSWFPVRELKVDVPGANNAFGPIQLVHAHGRVALTTPMNNDPGCPCEFEARIRDTTADISSPTQFETFYLDQAPLNSFRWSFDVEGLFSATPGQQNYLLEVRLSGRANPNQPATYAVGSSSSLTVSSFPFSLQLADE